MNNLAKEKTKNEENKELERPTMTQTTPNNSNKKQKKLVSKYNKNGLLLNGQLNAQDTENHMNNNITSSDLDESVQSEQIENYLKNEELIDDEEGEIVKILSQVDLSQETSNISSKTKKCLPIEYVQYKSELQMAMIMKIIQKDLSEPYSIYTYRYFIHNWPKLCFLAMFNNECVGAIVCKLDIHRKVIKRGYIAMLAVDQNFRNHGIGSTLVRMAIQEMINGQADEVVLETEVTNKAALGLYEALGFVRDKRLFRYYLNGVDALRLKLWLR